MGHRKLPYNVNPPFHERPRGKDGGESFWRKVRYIYEVLAAVTTLNITSRVQVHSGPIVGSSECSISKAASPSVVATLTLMKFS